MVRPQNGVYDNRRGNKTKGCTIATNLLEENTKTSFCTTRSSYYSYITHMPKNDIF